MYVILTRACSCGESSRLLLTLVIVGSLLAAWIGDPASVRAQSVMCQACDLDGDDDIDQSDFAKLQLCYSGSGVSQENPSCVSARFDSDSDVDQDDLALLTACVSGPRVPIPPGRLYITEFMASNSATIVDPDEPTEYPDWIELYNDTPAPLELGGMYLTNDLDQKTLWRIPDGVRIDGGSYLLFWADNEAEQGPRHTSFKLPKEGGDVGLIAPDGKTVIDSVSYGTQGTDISMGRVPDVSNTWKFVQQPTPGQPNIQKLNEAKVLITEIMYRPYAAEFAPEPTAEEFIELYNAGDAPVDISGWRFSEGISFKFPTGTLLGRHEYLTVAADLAAFQAKYPTVTHVVGGWTKRLSNDSETVSLVDAGGRGIDQVQYADEGDWAVRQRGPLDHGHYGWEWYTASDGLGSSMELTSMTLPGKYGHNWAASTVAGGTPGAPNSTASIDIAPIIGDVKQTPTIPHSDEAVLVTAQIIDESTTGLSVKVHYRRDGTATFTALELLDDGNHGDGTAGDGVYGGTLPAQAHGTIVEYYFKAADAAGHVRHQPAFALPTNTPLANRLYLVDDAFDPTWQAGRQPTYYIIMTAAERAELADIGDSSTDGISEQESNAQMNGTFVSVDEEGVKSRFNVGVRNRGKGTRTGPPNNYRINFVTEHLWNDMAQLVLNCRYPWLQLMGNQIFQAAGLPNADTKLVQVRVNGQNLAQSGRLMYGSYMFLEPYSGEWAENHFPNDDNGNVYRCIGFVGSPQQFATLNYLGPDPASYRLNYNKDSHGSLEEWADLINLTNVLTYASDATYEQDVAGVINVDQWLRWFAVQSLIGNAETNLGNGAGDDYSMYSGVKDPRFVVMPHDLDTVLGTGNGTPATAADSIWLAAKVPNMKRFLQHPAFCYRYYRQLRELMQTVFAPAQFNATVDNLLAGTPATAEAAAMKQFVVNRNAYVISQIPSALTIQSDLPTLAGHMYSTQAIAALYGQGNAYDTRSVVANGQLAQWDCVAGTWKIGTSGNTDTVTLIAKGSTWRYLDNGSNQGTAWKETGFDDSSWKGPQAARLGYGNDGETSPALSYGSDSSNKYVTYYFRRSFPVGDTSKYASLKLRLLRDDGAAVYLNGTKVTLPQTVDNMPDSFDYLTLASSTIGDEEEDTYYEASVSPSLLIPNSTNVIAVEVHQSVRDSTDLGFNLELVAETSAMTLIAKGSTWRYLDNGSNQGTAWKETGFNDSSWKGPQAARLGYGNDGETSPALSYGADSSNKYVTYYFRRSFPVGDSTKYTGLKLRLLRDDGAAVYLNGTKLTLPQTVDNMPDSFDYLTLASSTIGDEEEDTYYEASISPTLLTANTTNVIAVEVHQSVRDSTDLGFDLELVAETVALTTGVPLTPGLNTVLIQAFDGPDGTGNEIERGTIDILYDDTTQNVLSGTLSTDKTLSAAAGPWHVTGDVTVPAGVTLTIEPGAILFFQPSTGLTVNGKLVAQGTEAAHIILTRAPGTSGTWDGLAFSSTQQANVVSYVDQSYGDAQGHSIGVTSSRLLLDHVTWSNVTTTMLEVDHPSIVVQNCVVPGAGSKELFHGLYLSGSEYFIIQNTTFGVPTGYNDVIDFSGCKRPGPILQIYNCTFLGGRDDGPDLDGTDAHIEGNVFTDFYWGTGNPGTSSAISTGIRLDLNSEVTVVRNVFINCDHALLLKEDCFAWFENNTVYDANIAVINFGEPERGYTPGRGAALDGNILYGYPMVFQNLDLNPSLQLTMNRTLVAASEHGYGVGNIDADPLFVNPPADLHLQPGSPAIGAGPNGVDMGAYVPGGASVSGEPNGITDQTTATLTVAGPGVTHYRYRIRDDGTWGPWTTADRPVSEALTVTGLQDGHSYAVQVMGRNSAGALESEADAVTSKTWVVDTSP